MGDKKLTEQGISDIDKALAAAKARKKAKENGTAVEGSTNTATEPTAPKEPKRPRLSDTEKEERATKLATERAERKTARDAARTEKIAARTASKQPAHMKKVEKAAEKLTALGQAAELLFSEATTNLTASELAALATHIQHFNRVKATERALDQTIEAGQTVKIVGGDPRFIGKTGTVSKAQRIRCYVTVEGFKKDAYLFTSDVELVQVEATEEPAQATG